MLTLLLIIPLIGSLLLLPINEDSNDSKSLNKNKMRQIALATSLINLILSVVL
jgi:NADH-ubiquinone oxidoreductase chain 4